MANAALPGRLPPESTCVAVTEHEVPSSKRKRRTRFPVFLAINVIIIVVVTATLTLLEFGPIPQTKLGFYCKDPLISHPFRGDTIGLGLLLGGCLLGPLLIIAAIELHREKTVNKNWGNIIWRWFRDYLVGFCFNLFFAEIIKMVVGELRPHFLDSCLPDSAKNCKAGEYITEYTCTNTYLTTFYINDASRSFPSGHASLSVYTSFFCALYIHHRLISRYSLIIIKPFLIGLVIIWSVVCSFTRISDHRHHWWDVLFGSLLGLAITYYTVITLCKRFQTPIHVSKARGPTASTTTLLDVKNKDATSVII